MESASRGLAVVAPRGRAGVVLFETLWAITLLVALLVGAHIALVKYWNREIQNLQDKRMKYDGVELWKN